MTLQGRSLQRLCYSILRLNITGPRNLPSATTGGNVAQGFLTRPYHSHTCSSHSDPHPFVSSLPTQKGESDPSQTVSARRFVERTDPLISPGKTTAFTLSSWPGEQHLQYILPSEKLSNLPELVILEESPNLQAYELPQQPSLQSSVVDPLARTSVSDPTPSAAHAPKMARHIMKIRRQKMNRHRLLKFRKKYKFLLRRKKLERRKKKEAKFAARLASIREWGENFSAHKWMEEELYKARRGGFYVNILAKDRR